MTTRNNEALDKEHVLCSKTEINGTSDIENTIYIPKTDRNESI